MICGIGIDMTTVDRFSNWINNNSILERYFNSQEQCSQKSENYMKEHYAVRFAAKEAFGKALGTGINGFKLSDVYIKNEISGKPVIIVKDSAEKKLKELYGECSLHVSLSHEKNNAIAIVIIEK